VRSSTGDVRVGLIGYGLAGAVFHAPLIAATPGLRLAAVVTRDAERQARARREHPGVRLLDTPDPLWDGGAGAVDLVVVASPNSTHVPLAAAAIAAGRHVVVDKPVARTAAEVAALAAAARAAGWCSRRSTTGAGTATSAPCGGSSPMAR
jgi:predicted dehydrogenase